MLRSGLALAMLLAVGAAPVPAPHSGMPVDIAASVVPHPFIAAGRWRLGYELRIANFSTHPMVLKALTISGDAGAIETLSGADLAQHLVLLGTAEGSPGRPVLAPGATLTAFVDLTGSGPAGVPRSLHHQLTLAVTLPDGTVLERPVDGPIVQVGAPAPTIAAPLRGGPWVAVNGLFGIGHRRSFNAVDGHEYLAQRFAIDWLGLFPDGSAQRGPAPENRSWAGYGAPVLAVADATVTEVRDDLPDNVAATDERAIPITVDTAVGNHVVLDLGGGTWALYAHLRPGSVRVTPGQHVHTGDVLGLLGNSGNSDGPHLHFQLMDGPVPLGAEGLPFQMSGFTDLGTLRHEQVIDGKGAWHAATPPEPVRNSLPTDNEVVRFP